MINQLTWSFLAKVHYHNHSRDHNMGAAIFKTLQKKYKLFISKRYIIILILRWHIVRNICLCSISKSRRILRRLNWKFYFLSHFESLWRQISAKKEWRLWAKEPTAWSYGKKQENQNCNEFLWFQISQTHFICLLILLILAFNDF